MKRTTLERTFWSAAAVAALATALGWRGAVAAASAPGAAPRSTRHYTLPRSVAPESVTAAARAVVARDPFRLERRPASVAYGAEAELAASAPPAPRPPRPALAVGGIVGGPGRWAALLEGVPGRDGGVLVRRGDRLGGELLVSAIGRDTVVVRGADTTWRLVVRGVRP